MAGTLSNVWIVHSDGLIRFDHIASLTCYRRDKFDDVVAYMTSSTGHTGTTGAIRATSYTIAQVPSGAGPGLIRRLVATAASHADSRRAASIAESNGSWKVTWL